MAERKRGCATRYATLPRGSVSTHPRSSDYVIADRFALCIRPGLSQRWPHAHCSVHPVMKILSLSTFCSQKRDVKRTRFGRSFHPDAFERGSESLMIYLQDPRMLPMLSPGTCSTFSSVDFRHSRTGASRPDGPSKSSAEFPVVLLEEFQVQLAAVVVRYHSH